MLLTGAARYLGAGSPSFNVDVALRSTEQQQLEYDNALYEYGLALGNRWSRERSTD